MPYNISRLLSVNSVLIFILKISWFIFRAFNQNNMHDGLWSCWYFARNPREHGGIVWWSSHKTTCVRECMLDILTIFLSWYPLFLSLLLPSCGKLVMRVKLSWVWLCLLPVHLTGDWHMVKGSGFMIIPRLLNKYLGILDLLLFKKRELFCGLLYLSLENFLVLVFT